MEITEQWIGKIAGWKMLKAGRAVWKSGVVKEAEILEGGALVSGQIRGGDKPKVVKIHINGAFDVDNKCSCFKARRTGEICEHAVAVLLFAVNGSAEVEWSTESKKQVKQKPSFEPLPLRVELPPIFPNRLANGMTIRLHEEERTLTANDLLLCNWLHQLGLKEVPPMLPIRSSDVAGLLAILEGSGSVVAGDDSVGFLGGTVRLPVEVEQDDDRIGFSCVKNEVVDYVFLKEGIGVWDKEQRMFAMPKLKAAAITSGQMERLTNGGSLFVSVKKFLRDLSSWETALDWGQADLLDSLRVMPATANIYLTLEGSLSKLRAKLEARYPGGHRVNAGYSAGSDEDAFPIQDRNNQGVWLIRNSEAENDAAHKLLQAGFDMQGSGSWELDGEDTVLDFLSGVLPDLKKSWNVESGQALQRMQNNVVRVKPSIDFESSGEDWLSFEYGFETEDGRAIPRAMIEKMLRAGKRSATTKNGKRVVISAFDAGVMSEVLRDIDPRQEEGQYFVSKNQGAYLSRLKQYYGKAGEVISESCIKQLPSAILETLREYQEEGIAWLYQRVKNEGAALLADDMGLGKTLQTLSLIELLQRENSQPALVVCPTSLLSNWKEEVEKFYPDKKVVVMHGPSRKGKFTSLSASDIVVTSYALIARDREEYEELDFCCCIIDEASVIRNPDTQAAKALRRLKINNRIALTGTPVENALQDLWSIFEWMMPRYLGTKDDFKVRYVKECTLSRPDPAVLKRLRLRVEPFMLRRTKQEVAKDLPPKIEQIVWCEPTSEQQQIYRTALEGGIKKVAEAEKLGKGMGKMQMLTALLRLRQVCCDARLLGEEFDSLEMAQASAKLLRLLELVRQAKAGGHRLLVFSQFTSMLALIKEMLDEEGVSYSYLDGATRNRGEVVKAFQKDNGPTAFLISLKAGGYGLNLTAADMVVHFDPWWNPAVEAQATDRAYRIGQTKPVNVYKLITRGTVEEKIVRLQDKKKGLIGATVDEEVMMSGLDQGEIESLLKL